MIEVTFYSKKDCHLCEVALNYLEEIQSSIPHHVNIIDVDSDPKLRNLYGFNVPVISIGPYKLTAPINKKDLEISLMAVQHSRHQNAKLDKAIEEGRLQIPVYWTRSDGISLWLSKHYLALFNVLIFLYVGIPFLAPTFMKVNLTAPAQVIYRAYGYVCHQLAFRSWFLFGPQLVYPRTEAGVANLISYQQATGLDGYDLLSARAFIGNPQLGFKVALCERDVAIYEGILLFGILYAFLRKKSKIKPLHWILWILIAIIPIGLDGFSQLISQPPLSLIPFRESTPILRALTGFLFGFFTAWFGYPYVEESMVENQKFLDGKFTQALRWVGSNLNSKE
jgi:uncharacterized membrane protein/glutaredoxin